MIKAKFTYHEAEPIKANFTFNKPQAVTAKMSTNLMGTRHHELLINRDLPDQHPISAITGLEEALSTFVFEQGIASDEWVIEHNLNKYPSVSVVDSANNVITPEVEYIDLNNIVVRMNGATTGKAFLN